MRLLLDTGVFLMLASEPDRLAAGLRRTINDAEVVVLSAVSAWEIAIKSSVGKLQLPAPAGDYVRGRTLDLQLSPLQVTFDHVAAVESIPVHHRDPFDRLLIAQAQLEGLTIATTDRLFSRYGVRLIGVPFSPIVPPKKSRAKKSRTRRAALSA